MPQSKYDINFGHIGSVGAIHTGDKTTNVTVDNSNNVSIDTGSALSLDEIASLLAVFNTNSASLIEQHLIELKKLSELQAPKPEDRSRNGHLVGSIANILRNSFPALAALSKVLSGNLLDKD